MGALEWFGTQMAIMCAELKKLDRVINTVKDSWLDVSPGTSIAMHKAINVLEDGETKLLKRILALLSDAQDEWLGITYMRDHIGEQATRDALEEAEEEILFRALNKGRCGYLSGEYRDLSARYISTDIVSKFSCLFVKDGNIYIK